MSELPEGWVEATLGDVVEYGKATKADPDQIGPDTWVLELEDIEKDSSKILQRVVFVDRQSKSTKNHFKKGDVLYGKLRPYLNKIVIADMDGVCTTEIVPLSCGQNLDNRYLFHWFKHPIFVDYVTQVGRGVNMPRLGTEDGVNAPFVLAPLAEQKVIADKLDALLAQVDTLKARLDAIPAILKRFRQSVLSAAVTGKLTEEWRQKNQLESLSLQEFINHAFYERMNFFNQEVQRAKGDRRKIQYGKPALEFFESSYDLGIDTPPGWILVHMGDICTVVRGASPRPASDPKYFGGDTPWITVAEITKDDGVYLHNTERGLSPEGRECSRYVEAGTLMLTNSGATLGVPKILGIGGCFNDGSVALLDHVFTNKHYLYFFLRSQTKAMRLINQGAAQPNLNTEIVRCLEVPIPPLPEQTEIVRRVESLFAFADQIEARVQEATARVKHLTQSILAKAFRGELTEEWRKAHPELVSGENSAEALLERIRAVRSEAPEAKGKRGRKAQQSPSEARMSSEDFSPSPSAPKKRGRPRKG